MSERTRPRGVRPPGPAADFGDDGERAERTFARRLWLDGTMIPVCSPSRIITSPPKPGDQPAGPISRALARSRIPVNLLVPPDELDKPLNVEIRITCDVWRIVCFYFDSSVTNRIPAALLSSCLKPLDLAAPQPGTVRVGDPHAHRAPTSRIDYCSTSISPLARFAQSHAHTCGNRHGPCAWRGACHGVGHAHAGPICVRVHSTSQKLTCAPDLIPLPLAYLLRRARAIDLSYHAAASISASTSASMSA